MRLNPLALLVMFEAALVGAIFGFPLVGLAIGVGIVIVLTILQNLPG